MERGRGNGETKEVERNLVVGKACLTEMCSSERNNACVLGMNLETFCFRYGSGVKCALSYVCGKLETSSKFIWLVEVAGDRRLKFYKY